MTIPKKTVLNRKETSYSEFSSTSLSSRIYAYSLIIYILYPNFNISQPNYTSAYIGPLNSRLQNCGIVLTAAALIHMMKALVNQNILNEVLLPQVLFNNFLRTRAVDKTYP